MRFFFLRPAACLPVALLLSLTSWSFSQTAAAAPPLHEQIDQLIEQAAGDLPLAEQADDYEFVRRIYLDLAGRIPTLQEVQTFVGDESPDRRGQLVDKLLAGPDYPRRMQELFNVILMERRVDNADWQAFLKDCFAKNMPWDEIAQRILNPDAEDEIARSAALFYTARLVSEGAMAPVDVPGLTRDVGRLFAGVDLQCAQCHDHLYIEDYKQRQFQGLHLIFENLTTRRDVQFPAVAEKVLTGKQEYMSVFVQQPEAVGVLLPGENEVEIPTFEKGEEYAVEPDRKAKTPGVPKFSPLRVLAENLARPGNDPFCRNIANRLWFVMMGRGLVEPLDLHHASNPPSHPELLQLLASEFAAGDFNIRWFLGELARTKTYQRTSRIDPNATEPPIDRYTVGLEKRMSAEQMLWSVLAAMGELTADGQEKKPEKGGKSVVTEYRKLFLDAFANPPKEPEVEYEPTVKAALFLSNDDRMLALTRREEGNLTDQVCKLEGDAMFDELFLAILARRPTAEDKADLAAYLQESADRDQAVADLVWSLLTSMEFCVNH